jgi:hypothetical protein
MRERLVAVGEAALWLREHDVVLHGARGPIGAWERPLFTDADVGTRFARRGSSVAFMAQPARLAITLVDGVSGKQKLAVNQPWAQVEVQRCEIVLLDPATGEVHASVVATTNTRALGFSEDGEHLFVADDDSLSVLDARLRPIARVTGVRNVSAVHLAKDARRAIAVGTVEGMTVAYAVDVDAGHAAPVSALTHALISARGDRIVTAETGYDDEDGTDHYFTRLVWRDAAGRELAATRAPPQAGPLWGDEHLNVVTAQAYRHSFHTYDFATRDSAGEPQHHGFVAPHDAEGPLVVVDADVDADRMLLCDEAAALVRLASFRTSASRILATVAGATSSCLTGATSSAVAVVGGVAQVLDEDGVHGVEGPTSIVCVGPHPRGVVAVDADGRAHVIAL